MPCFRPIEIGKNGYADLRVKVPCGRCIGCRLGRASMWALRCKHEASLHELNVFVTLTYDKENLPADGGLVKKHFQDFMKRLRWHHLPALLRFFACGEYGAAKEIRDGLGNVITDPLGRPHYHAILFGIDFPDKRPYSKNNRGDQLFTSETLDKIWGFGRCWLGSVTVESAGYVARYVVKKITGDLAEAHYRGRSPEFALMSRRPGLGAGWYEKYKSDCFPSDFLTHKGKKRPVPKFYTERLKRDDPEAHEAVKKARVLNARKYSSDQTSKRLAVREEVTTARVRSLKRIIE